MGEHMPWGMGYVMRCPVCGESMLKPSKEEIIEILDRGKKRMEGALNHINMEIAKLKEKSLKKRREICDKTLFNLNYLHPMQSIARCSVP